MESERLPIRRKSVFGRAQDFVNGLTIRGGEMRKLRSGVFSREHFPQTAIDSVPRRSRHRVERLRVNHVAAWIAKHSSVQIEIPKRPSLRILRPLFWKFGCEIG